jgi:Zn-dependent M28 family amino/carboxypeptidase
VEDEGVHLVAVVGVRDRRSTYFVENLSDAERPDIMANLNFDMMVSPNFARLV